jgi:hypothetical protein
VDDTFQAIAVLPELTGPNLKRKESVNWKVEGWRQ